MGSYTLVITPSAQKELDRIDDTIFDRIDGKILALAEDPRPHGCRKLRGYRNQWRIRVGDWRVIYVIDDARALVTVTRVAHRREVYDQ